MEEARSQWRNAMNEVRRRSEEKAAGIAEARKRTQEAASGTKSAGERLGMFGGRAVGSWSAEALNSMLGGSNPAEERTANAAETSVKLQVETNRQLRKISGNTLSYGG
jgi:hypothetical protein